jgi:hypothetical protein
MRRAIFKPRSSDDPWKGRQPRYLRLTVTDSGQYALAATLPSGEPVEVRLGRLSPHGGPGRSQP